MFFKWNFIIIFMSENSPYLNISAQPSSVKSVSTTMSDITLKLTKHPLQRKVSIFPFLKQFIDSVLIYAGNSNVSQFPLTSQWLKGPWQVSISYWSDGPDLYFWKYLNVLDCRPWPMQQASQQIWQHALAREAQGMGKHFSETAPSRRCSSKKLQTQASALEQVEW